MRRIYIGFSASECLKEYIEIDSLKYQENLTVEAKAGTVGVMIVNFLTNSESFIHRAKGRE